MTFLRLCAVILCISSSLIAYSQNRVDFKFDRSTNTYTVPGSDKHYYVFNYPGLSQHELFNRVKMAIIMETGVDELKDEPASVTDEMLQTGKRITIFPEKSGSDSWVDFRIVFKFKDEKIFVHRPISWYTFEATNFNNASYVKMHKINEFINDILGIMDYDLELEW